MNTFVHLNVQSFYSKGWGVDSPETLCLAAKEKGFHRLALTDRNGLYGMMPFLRLSRETPILPLLGAEITAPESATSSELSLSRAVLWVTTMQGYKNLCHLLSLRHDHPRFDLEEFLPRHREGLIVASDSFRLLKTLKKQSLQNLYVELSPGYALHECLAFSKESGIPPLATNRVAFVSPASWKAHRLLCAIQQNTKLSRLRPMHTAREAGFLCDTAHMEERFPHVPEALENTLRVADACFRDWDFSKLVFPKNTDSQDSVKRLYAMALEGCRKRYGQLRPEVLSRLEHEMDIVERKGFADYFLVVKDIKDQSSLTCGRGSAAASIIAYALEITHVDPIKHRLFFERFLNLSRKDPPDIDIDFAWDERDAVLDYVFAKHGAKRAAMVANHNMLKERSSIREVAKVYGLTDGEISRVTQKFSRVRPDSRDLPKPWPEILSTARQIQGPLRCLSVHCGGVVIVPEDIRDLVPVETARKGVPVVQWDKDGVEEAGLVKIDLLGNRSLAVIRDALRAVAKNGGPVLEYASLRPEEDPKAVSTFYNASTMGVFYFESPATRILLGKVGKSLTWEDYLHSEHFEINTLVTSIIRPASNTYITEWVERIRGKPWDSLHPLLAEPLNETQGIMVYQEQLSLAAIHLAGFSADEGDELRKVVSKKHRAKRLADFKIQFEEGARQRDVPENVIQDVWGMICSFDGYSFCKPHSASYTKVAYKSAWLKARHPAEFMAAVISNQGGFYSAFAYFSECKRLGLQVHLPDVNASEYAHTGKTQSIRIGFMQIHDLPKPSVERLLQERAQNGAFSSFSDFCHRVPTEPSSLRILIKAGCFDSLHGKNARLSLLWETFLHPSRKTQQEELFSASGAEPLPVGDTPSGFCIRHELETLGFTLSVHPLDLFEPYLRLIPRRTWAKDLEKHIGKQIQLIGWIITGKRIYTKNDDPMEFVTLEDQSGLFETVIFPDVYQHVCAHLGETRPYLVTGTVHDDQGIPILHVQDLKVIELPPKKEL